MEIAVLVGLAGEISSLRGLVHTVVNWSSGGDGEGRGGVGGCNNGCDKGSAVIVRRVIAAFGVVAAAVKGQVKGRAGSGFGGDCDGCSNNAAVGTVLEGALEVLAGEVAGAVEVGAVDGGH